MEIQGSDSSGISCVHENRVVLNNVKVDRLKFLLPLSYNPQDSLDCTPKPSPSTDNIRVTAQLCQKYDPFQSTLLPKDPKVVAFIQGGPGFGCPPAHENMAYTKVFLDRGYQVLYMDQRGTGLSTPIDCTTFSILVKREPEESEDSYTERQLEFLQNFSAVSIVNDLELIRNFLLGDVKWSISGQSFGGFCCFTYMSNFPSYVKECFVTGGVPPINYHATDVYKATYGRARDRNKHYYNKYPQDENRVRQILQYLQLNNVKLPDGGDLSVERFQQLGINFGGHGGTDQVHSIVSALSNDLTTYRTFSYTSLSMVQSLVSFGTNILYALLQEAIYCDGFNHDTFPSNWAAERAKHLPENRSFIYENSSDREVFFTTEMVFPSMFSDYSQLRPFKNLANALHSCTKWPKLYNPNVLSLKDFTMVPIVGAIYVNDLYVDYDLTTKVLKKLFKGNNFRAYITNEFFHNGYKKDPERVMGMLFNLLDQEID